MHQHSPLFLLFLIVAVNYVVLDHPKNGFVSSSSTVDGGTATYSCKLGFVLEGEDTHTCTSAGNWSGTEPTCRSACVCEAVRFGCNVMMVLVLQRTAHCCNLCSASTEVQAFTVYYACIIPVGKLDSVQKFSSRI